MEFNSVNREAMDSSLYDDNRNRNNNVCSSDDDNSMKELANALQLSENLTLSDSKEAADFKPAPNKRLSTKTKTDENCNSSTSSQNSIDIENQTLTQRTVSSHTSHPDTLLSNLDINRLSLQKETPNPSRQAETLHSTQTNTTPSSIISHCQRSTGPLGGITVTSFRRIRGLFHVWTMFWSALLGVCVFNAVIVPGMFFRVTSKLYRRAATSMVYSWLIFCAVRVFGFVCFVK